MVLGSEFGRTPFHEEPHRQGRILRRDHFRLLHHGAVAGGGVKGRHDVRGIRRTRLQRGEDRVGCTTFSHDPALSRRIQYERLTFPVPGTRLPHLRMGG